MIELNELTKVYNEDLVAVDQLSLTVAKGEVYGLLGPNGAGKTTTLRMILGLLPPTSGDVKILGRHVSSEPLRVKRLIGLVSASAGLYQRFVLPMLGKPTEPVASPITCRQINNIGQIARPKTSADGELDRSVQL